MRIKYCAFDGKKFNEPIECKKYEEEKMLPITSCIQQIKDFCEQIGNCENCPLFYIEYDRCSLSKEPFEWE